MPTTQKQVHIYSVETHDGYFFKYKNAKMTEIVVMQSYLELLQDPQIHVASE